MTWMDLPQYAAMAIMLAELRALRAALAQLADGVRADLRAVLGVLVAQIPRGAGEAPAGVAPVRIPREGRDGIGDGAEGGEDRADFGEERPGVQ